MLDYCKVNIAKPSLELGGKTPVIVEPDADLDMVAARIVAAKTNHCGQLCTAVERVYVHEAVHDALLVLMVVNDDVTVPQPLVHSIDGPRCQ